MKLRVRSRAWLAAQAAALAAVGLLAASCGRDVATLEATPGPAGSPTSEAPSETPAPTSTRTLPPLTERPTLPSKQPRDPYSKRKYPIKSANVDKRDARKVLVTYELPTPCSPGLDRAAVAELPGEVVVTLLGKPADPAQKPICAQVIQEKTVTVNLDEPLANRKLIDGSTGLTVAG